MMQYTAEAQQKALVFDTGYKVFTCVIYIKTNPSYVNKYVYYLN